MNNLSVVFCKFIVFALVPSALLAQVQDTISVPNKKSSSGSGLEHPVVYNADDSTKYDLANKQVLLYGNASIDYGKMKLRAHHIVYNWETGDLTAYGETDSIDSEFNPKASFEDGSQNFNAPIIQYNFTSETGRISSLYTQEGEGYILGDRVYKDSVNQLYAYDAKYTTCNLEEPHFCISARRLKIIPDKVAISGPANLQLAGIPTPLALPFAVFPLTKGKRSGLIPPEFSSTQQFGFALNNLGWYFPINEHTDLTVKTDIYTNGSWRINLGNTWSKKYKYNGNVNLRLGNIKTGQEFSSEASTQRDFAIQGRWTIDPKAIPNNTFNASVNIQTSSFNQFNSFDFQQRLNNTLRSSINYTRSFPDKPFRLSLSANHSQNNSTGSVSVELPRATFNVNRIQPFKRENGVGKEKWFEKIAFNYTMDAQNSVQTIDTLFGTPQMFEDVEFGISHTIPINASYKIAKFINWTPSFTYNENWYANSFNYQDFVQDSSGTSILVDPVKQTGFTAERYFNASVSLATRIYTRLTFTSGPIDAIRWVLNPAVSANYRPDYSTPFWNYYQDQIVNEEGRVESKYKLPTLYGRAPSGEQAGLSFSIGNNVEMKLRKTDSTGKQKKIAILEGLTISTSYNAAVDSFQWSDIRINGRTRLFNKNLGVNFNSSYSLYEIDSARKVNALLWDSGEFPELLSFGLSLDFAVSSDKIGAADWGGLPYGFMMMGMPMTEIQNRSTWSINTGLSYQWRNGFPQSNTTANLSVSGNWKPSEKWDLRVSTGYDIEQKQLAYTKIDAYRDLHCWEMRLSYIPTGLLKSYQFGINVKASTLKDLKYERRTNPLDNF